MNQQLATTSTSGYIQPVTPAQITIRRASRLANLPAVATIVPRRQVSPEEKLWVHIIGKLYRDIASQGPNWMAHRDAIRAKVELDEVLAILWPGATTERLIAAALREWEAGQAVGRRIAPRKLK